MRFVLGSDCRPQGVLIYGAIVLDAALLEIRWREFAEVPTLLYVTSARAKSSHLHFSGSETYCKNLILQNSILYD